MFEQLEKMLLEEIEKKEKRLKSIDNMIQSRISKLVEEKRVIEEANSGMKKDVEDLKKLGTPKKSMAN